MSTNTRRWFSMMAALVLALSLLSFANGAQAQGDSHTFPETGHTVSGKFLEYWNSHGGLAQQGYPLTEAHNEVSPIDGKTYLTQYFERSVMELHPEHAGTPFEVLLSLLGSIRYQQKYSVSAPKQTVNSQAGAVKFAQTGHTVGGKFLDYWNNHGGLMQQGYPVSDEFTEVSELNGKPYTVQYFERAVMELH